MIYFPFLSSHWVQCLSNFAFLTLIVCFLVETIYVCQVMSAIDDKDVEMKGGVVELNGEVASGDSTDGGNRDDQEMAYYGKKQQLKVSSSSQHRDRTSNCSRTFAQLTSVRGILVFGQSLDLFVAYCQRGKACLRMLPTASVGLD